MHVGEKTEEWRRVGRYATGFDHEIEMSETWKDPGHFGRC